MDTDRKLLAVEEILAFRDELAALVAKHLQSDFAHDCLASFQGYADGQMYTFDGIYSDRDGRTDKLIPDANKSFHTTIALIARYRPESPAPDATDLLRLGVHLSRSYIPCKVGTLSPFGFRHVEVLDYMIVDGEGRWCSVYDFGGLGASMWCASCLKHVHGDILDYHPEDDVDADWKDIAERHRPGCAYVVNEGAL